MIVMKFGGTSVRGAERMRRVAEIVHNRLGEGPVVVTSAMAGVTDALSGLFEIALRGDREGLDMGLGRLRELHLGVAAELGGAGQSLEARLESHLRELRVLLRGLRLVGTARARSRDAVLGHGELMAQELLAAALTAAGCPTRLVPSTRVVVTDACFGAAAPDLEGTRRQARTEVSPLVEQGVVPVLGGYVGASPEGLPTTLGRGGSDLSASLLGLALGADAVEIWTDVDGLMTADPRRVQGARILPRATFREAAELAGFGAKVLHPASIDPALQGGVPVWIRNSLAPSRPGTLIGRQASGGGEVRAIASRASMAELRLHCPGRAMEGDFLGRLLLAATGPGPAPIQVAVGPAGVAIILPAEQASLAERQLVDLGEVQITAPLGLVAAVGEGLAHRPDRWALWLEQAADLGLRRIVQGPFGSSLGVLLSESNVQTLVERWHALCLSSVEEGP
ncbi:MAG TPA: aspartate kinase [Acidobacteria bacterium]|nr:aspartate kinase [Acidobacteriota bacterium]